MGPKIEPWGTPLDFSRQSDVWPSYVDTLSSIREVISERSEPKPAFLGLFSSTSWSTESNASD